MAVVAASVPPGLRIVTLPGVVMRWCLLGFFIVLGCIAA